MTDDAVAARERYRAFVANSTEGIWRFDLETPVAIAASEEEQIDAFYRCGFLAEANDAFGRMYGFNSGEELVGAHVGDLLIREDPANEAYLRAFIRSGYRLEDVESVERDREGHVRHFSNTLTGIVENGMLVRAWGTQRDITAQRAAERKAERIAADLRLVTDAAPVLISYIGSDLRYRFVNKGYADWFGQPARELVGKTVAEVIGAAAFEKARPLIERVLAGERVTYETLLPYDEGGTPRFVHGDMVPDAEEDGTIRGYVAVLSDISARRAAEAAREQLLAQLEAVLQTARDGIIVSDPLGNLLLWNPAGLAMHGYANLEDACRRLPEFTDTFTLYLPDENDEPIALDAWPLARLMRGETFSDYELRIRRLNSGHEWWASYSGAIARSGEGVPFLLVLTVRDVSDRKAAEQAQREAVAALLAKSREVTSILESVTDAFFALDDAWNFTYVNAEAARVLQREANDLIDKNIWEEFPSAVGSLFETEYRRAMQNRVTVVFQAFYPAPLDSWYDVRAYPSPIGTGLSVYFRNINEERRKDAEREALVAALEAANARQRASLHQSEELFRLLVEGVQDYAIFMLDPDGKVVTWNAGAERLNGYQAHEIIGQHFSRFYTPEDVARRHPWNELEIATREGRYEEEGWRVRKDGSQFWANVFITALRDENGVLRGFGKLTRDFTERRQREQERAAAQVLQQQRRFLKDILLSVTYGRLLLCDSAEELPAPLSPEPVGDTIFLSAKTLRAVRAQVASVASACDLPPQRTQDIITAASEGAMNAVQHGGGGGKAMVYSDPKTGRLQVWLIDQGKGIDLSNLPRATLEPGFSTGGGGIGHGFSLILSCCQRMYLRTGADGTTLVLEQGRSTPELPWLQVSPEAS